MRKSWFLAFLGTFITVVLTIGCGGGGGGGGGANPVGPIAAGDFSDLSGTVVFDGKPLANANIYLYSSDGALAAGIGQLSSANNSVREAIIGNLAPGQLHTSSGLDGRYLFSHVPVGVYTLIAVKDATHQFARTGVVVGAITEVPVEITPTGTISGSIAISGRTSLGGGVVYLQGTSYVALSDDSGNFTIFNVPANTSFSLRASLANFSLSTPLSVQVTPGVTSNVGALVLTVASIPGTGNISGTVTRTGDTTQAGTLVLLRKSTGEAVTVTLTDSSGTYQLFGVASGNYQLEFTADNYLIPTPVAVAVISGQTISAAAVTMSSKVVPVVIGNFTGAASKTQLLSGESDNRGINLLLVNNSGSFLVTTDNAGAFAFNVPQGIYRFLALAPFQVVSGPATVINSSASVSVPGTPPTPNFVVSPVTPVAVPTAKFDFTGVATKATRLNDENDDSGMTLLMDGGASLGVFSATTKSDGSFEFRGIPGGSYNFSVVGRYQLVSGPISITLKGNLVGNYPAQPAVAPTPFLVFAGLATKTVKLADESDDGGMTLLLTGPGGPFTTTTQTNGMFRFVGLKPGTYNFSITGRYELVLPSGNNGSDTVTIVTANVNRDYNARPTVAPKPLFQFTGIATKTLKLADEIDDGGMTLLLKGPGGPHTTTTLQNGNFKFSDLQPGAYQFSITGRYRLQVPASDNGSDSVAIVAADVVRSYNAQPSVAPAFYFAFSGSILKSPALDDEFNQGGINLLLANSSGSYTTISDINGNFKFNSIPAGAYNLSVQGRYRLTNPGASDTIALAGDISTGTYAVQPLLPVVGTLNGTTSKNQKIFPGEDESGVTVEISSTTPHRLFSATTDAVGSFSIPAVPIGNYQIKIISSSYRADAGPTTVTVVSPVTNFPTVNLIPLSLYTGSVSATQSPVTPRLRYILTNSVSGSRFETVSDSSGNIRFENIPPTPGNNYNFIVDPASGYALSAAVPAFSLPSKANLALGGVNVVFVAPGIDSVVVTPGVKVSAFGNNIASGPGALTRGFADWKEMPATSTPWVAGQADFEIANLSPGTYALKLSNPDGTSTSSGSFFIDLATPSFDGTSATFNSVTANWIPVPFAESYVVQLDSGPIVKILATSYTFKNLTANTSFNFKVRAVGLGLKGPVAYSAITTGRYAFPNPLERAAPFTWYASGDVTGGYRDSLLDQEVLYIRFHANGAINDAIAGYDTRTGAQTTPTTNEVLELKTDFAANGDSIYIASLTTGRVERYSPAMALTNTSPVVANMSIAKMAINPVSSEVYLWTCDATGAKFAILDSLLGGVSSVILPDYLNLPSGSSLSYENMRIEVSRDGSRVGFFQATGTMILYSIWTTNPIGEVASRSFSFVVNLPTYSVSPIDQKDFLLNVVAAGGKSYLFALSSPLFEPNGKGSDLGLQVSYDGFGRIWTMGQDNTSSGDKNATIAKRNSEGENLANLLLNRSPAYLDVTNHRGGKRCLHFDPVNKKVLAVTMSGTTVGIYTPVSYSFDASY